MLRQIISNGLPAGVQNSIIALANVVVQSNINSFGKMAMAGCGSYAKVEGFAFLPVTCFALSITTFTSQNIGAKKYDRVKRCPLRRTPVPSHWQNLWGSLCFFSFPI
ncbi:MAG: MATE family efflux transporter [Blautia sp.]